MKKLGIIAMAFALVLCMSQCKKENTNDEGAKVPITLNVNGASTPSTGSGTGSGTGGSRVVVETETGVVTFENGDVIYVVSNGTYVGTLTYNGTQFSGEVIEPAEGQKLQFYFLGNKTPEFNADNTGCSVVISDQTEHLPVISYAPSRENYQVGKTDYNATLLNKCALVKFDVTTSSDAATCIVGMNNKVTVNFTTNEFDYSQEGEGAITLPAGSGERWAILLPQDEVTEVQAQSEDGAYTGMCAAIPSIAENDYLTEGIAVAIEMSVGPVGIINGTFTINANGDQVWFSQGNLQYTKSTGIWSFMEHQYDMVEIDGQDVGEDYANQDVVSLFGWGTSGWNNGNVYYQPYNTADSSYRYYWSDLFDDDYYICYCYGPTNGEYFYGLTGAYSNADWGVYNAISNGGNMEGQWRTLTLDEWHYLLVERSTLSGILYAYGSVNGVNGVILLPDNWSESTYFLNDTNTSDSDEVSFSSNIISVSQWGILETAGAVFLPCAGLRENVWVDYVGSRGYYWSASLGDDFYEIGPTSWEFRLRPGGAYWVDPVDNACTGRSVRLVRDVE
jgi:hypothetical protein